MLLGEPLDGAGNLISGSARGCGNAVDFICDSGPARQQITLTERAGEPRRKDLSPGSNGGNNAREWWVAPKTNGRAPGD